MMMDDDEKYLSPLNPMLPIDRDAKPLEPGDEGYDGRAPFWTAETLGRMIERVSPADPFIF